MRPSRSSLEARGAASCVLALGGFAYLVYKAEYLGFDVPDGLKAFIVAPGVALLVAAVCFAFADRRRRLGGALLALGLVALLWTTSQNRFPEGFYAGSFQPGLVPAWPSLATALIPMGLALLVRRAWIAGSLLGCAAVFAFIAPSRVLLTLVLGQPNGMPRRYHYYYYKPAGAASALDVAIPATFTVAGIALIAVRLRRTT